MPLQRQQREEATAGRPGATERTGRAGRVSAMTFSGRAGCILKEKPRVRMRSLWIAQRLSRKWFQKKKRVGRQLTYWARLLQGAEISN